MKGTIKKILAVTLALALCLPLAACFPVNPPSGSESVAYVGIDINPSVELTLDKDGKVVTVYGANDDGQVLLWKEETNIVGKSYEDAVEYITELAIELGYLSAENPDVSATVSSDSSDADTIRRKVSAKIIAKADSLGLSVTVDSTTAFEVLRALDALKERYPENEAIQNLTPEKYKLAVRAADGGDITVEAAAELNTAELIERVNVVHKKLEGVATEAYRIAKAKANAIFDTASGVILDGVYSTVYGTRALKLLANPSYKDTIHLGAAYQAYKTAERTYGAIAELIEYAEEYAKTELDIDTVNRIAAALNLDDTSVLEDASGDVTVKSVSVYCDKLVREGALADAAEDAIEDILDEAEEAAQIIASSAEGIRSELETIKGAISGVINSVTTAAGAFINLPLLPENVKNEYADCLDYLKSVKDKITAIVSDGVTSDEIEELADEAKDKAEQILERINEDLTDAEKETVKSISATLEATLTGIKNNFNSALETAESEAKRYIEQKRNERLGNSAQ